MYSHYADSHKGICVEYEIELNNLENSDNISFGKVEYAQKEKITNLKDLYMLKNSEWTYELELAKSNIWRLINCSIRELKI